MKWIGRLALLMICATTIFVGVTGRAPWGELPTFGGHNAGRMVWDEQSRRRIDSVFYVEASDWMPGPNGALAGEADDSDEPVSSGIQSNPFFD